MADWKIWTTNRSKRRVVNVKTLTGQVEMKVPAGDTKEYCEERLFRGSRLKSQSKLRRGSRCKSQSKYEKARGVAATMGISGRTADRHRIFLDLRKRKITKKRKPRKSPRKQNKSKKRSGQCEPTNILLIQSAKLCIIHSTQRLRFSKSILDIVMMQ